MKLTVKSGLGLLFMILATTSVFAANGGSDSSMVNIVQGAIGRSADALLADAAKYLGLLMLLQFCITNYKLLPGSDFDGVMTKFIGSLIWFGFCWYIMESGPGFIKAVGGQFWSKFAGNIPTPDTIIAVGLFPVQAMLVVAVVAGATVAGTVFGQIVAAVAFAIMAVVVGFALKVFLLQLELALIAMLSPLSFSLLGLNALRDQGIAPFKSLLALIYRIVILGVLYGAYAYVGDALTEEVSKYQSFSWDSLQNVASGGQAMLKSIFAALAAYVFIAFLTWKSDAIAASLASGSSNMGTADIAGAVAAGTAAGLAASAAGQALMRPSQGMGDLMKNLLGPQKVGMNNASAKGELPGAVAKPDLPTGNMSVAEGGAAGVSGSESSTAAESSLPPNPNEFHGVPNPLASEKSGAERAAARQARRDARMGGSGKDAAIAGQQNGPSGPARGVSLGQRLDNLSHRVEREHATTHVTIGTHND